jgi:LysM repeat protein
MRARPALQNAIRPLPNIWLHKIRVRGWDSPPPGPAGPAAVSLTFNNANGQASLAVMMALERDLLSATASVIWIAALCAVLGFHCGHLFHTRGERRGYHCTHVVMLLGMLHMYAAVAFGLDLLPAPVWMIVYAVTSAVIIGWMLVRLLRRHSFGYLWILALVQQAAMIYMWVPMAYWVPRLSYVLAVFFALEAIAWLAAAYLLKPWPGIAVVQAGGSAVLPLAPKSAFGCICMMIMAASMGYMFTGMQLMMPAVRQSPQAAQQPAPQQSVSNRGGGVAGLPPPVQRPESAANEPARPSAPASSPAPARSYTVAAGDTLRRIAARLYGDARQWRDIIKANPGLHPRLLRVGQVIKLPTALSPQLPGSRSGSRSRDPPAKLNRLAH